MIRAFKEWRWKRRFVNQIRRINPRVSRSMAGLWADDWLATICGATSLSPEASAREELSVWDSKGE